MNILGITHDVINTSASLIINGKIVAAIAEERLTRQKKQDYSQQMLLNFVLITQI